MRVRSALAVLGTVAVAATAACGGHGGDGVRAADRDQAGDTARCHLGARVGRAWRAVAHLGAA